MFRSSPQPQPFRPIVLIEGVATIAAPKNRIFFWKSDPTDDEPIRQKIGVHRECGKPMYFFRVADTHTLVVCDPCGLRIVISKGIVTYGDLRRFSSASEGKP